jgi:hypothetical protein
MRAHVLGVVCVVACAERPSGGSIGDGGARQDRLYANKDIGVSRHDSGALRVDVAEMIDAFLFPRTLASARDLTSRRSRTRRATWNGRRIQTCGFIAARGSCGAGVLQRDRSTLPADAIGSGALLGAHRCGGNSQRSSKGPDREPGYACERRVPAAARDRRSAEALGMGIHTTGRVTSWMQYDDGFVILCVSADQIGCIWRCRGCVDTMVAYGSG